MKNHKYMLAMLLSSSLLVGCQGDFLNLPSETSWLSLKIWGN